MDEMSLRHTVGDMKIGDEAWIFNRSLYTDGNGRVWTRQDAEISNEFEDHAFNTPIRKGDGFRVSVTIGRKRKPQPLDNFLASVATQVPTAIIPLRIVDEAIYEEIE